MIMKRPYKSWEKAVQQILTNLGFKENTRLSGDWKDLWRDGLSPFEAVNTMEFDGTLTYSKYISKTKEVEP